MKIPEDMEPGYYWVKLGEEWIPSTLWKSVVYGKGDEVCWRVALAGIDHAFFATDHDVVELGPRLYGPERETVWHIEHLVVHYDWWHWLICKLRGHQFIDMPRASLPDRVADLALEESLYWIKSRQGGKTVLCVTCCKRCGEFKHKRPRIDWNES